MARTRRDPNGPYWIALRDAEARILQYAIESWGYDTETAADSLRISTSFFRRRCKVLGVATKPSKVTP